MPGATQVGPVPERGCLGTPASVRGGHPRTVLVLRPGGAAPWAPAGAPPPAAAGLGKAGAGWASIGHAHGRGGRALWFRPGRRGPAPRRAPCCDGTDRNPTSASLTRLCVRRGVRTKENHLRRPAWIAAQCYTQFVLICLRSI